MIVISICNNTFRPFAVCVRENSKFSELESRLIISLEEKRAFGLSKQRNHKSTFEGDETAFLRSRDYAIWKSRCIKRAARFPVEWEAHLSAILQGFSPAVLAQASERARGGGGKGRTKTDVSARAGWNYRDARWEWSQEETRHIRMKQWHLVSKVSLAIPPSICGGGGRSLTYQINRDHVNVAFPVT